jgi:NifU-like protein
VDKSDGVIIDARFSAFGNTALIGAGEVACELVIGKNYDQAQRINADFIDNYVRDRNDVAAFPEEARAEVDLVVELIANTASKCHGIPFASNYTSPPISSHEIEIVDGGYPGFKELPVNDKITVLEEVIAKEIRPYIELDKGGIEVLNVVGDEVIIAYSGACTSCHSATGATLSYIQQMLRAKIDTDLIVTPA